MASTVIVLENPKTGKTKKGPVGFSWLTLFTGFISPLLRGDILWSLIMFVAMLFTAGLSMLVFPFIYNKIYVKGLIKKGYRANSIDGTVLKNASEKLGFRLPVLDPTKIQGTTEEWQTDTQDFGDGPLIGWIKRHKIITGLVSTFIFFFLLLVIAALGGNKSNQNDQRANSSSVESKIQKDPTPTPAKSSAANEEVFTCVFTESAVLKSGDNALSEKQKLAAKSVYTLKIVDGMTDTSIPTGTSSKALGSGLHFQKREQKGDHVSDEYRNESTKYDPTYKANLTSYEQASLSRFNDGAVDFMYVWWDTTDPDKHFLFSSCKN